MLLQDEIELQKRKNWVELVATRADEIAEQHKHDIDNTICLLNNTYYLQAVEEVSKDIKAGKYDKMLMPIDCNL